MLNLFKNQCLLYSERPALSYRNQRYSYKELNKQSNQLAHYLKSKAVRNGTSVALISENFLERVISILALWKLGAAYVPIDPNYPSTRINFIMNDSKVNFIITDEEIYKKYFLNSSLTIILLDSKNNPKNNFSKDDLNDTMGADTIAYIAYTSGSTGKPKGVPITHANISSIYEAWKQVYHLTYLDRHLQIANFGFDVCSGDIIRALASGAQLVICPTEIILNPERLYKTLKKNAITIAEFTPIVLRKLIYYLKKEKLDLHFMRLLICGSDIWTLKEYKEAKTYLSADARLINSYGTTETTIDSTYFECDETMSPFNELSLVPLGKPFPNTKIKILNEQLKECPPEIQGEIYIGGSGVSQGYLNQPTLTKEKFISFSSTNGKNEIFYKSGDVGCYLMDGNIAFRGRVDTQIKIMGISVDLLEVENILNSYPNIEKAIVLHHSSLDSTEQFLVAYIQCDKIFNIKDYITFLKKRLPFYAIPVVYFPRNTFPVSPHGKVDRLTLNHNLIYGEQRSNEKNNFNENKINIKFEEKLLFILNRLLNIPHLTENNFFYINRQGLIVQFLKELKRDVSQVDATKLLSIYTVYDLHTFLEKNKVL